VLYRIADWNRDPNDQAWLAIRQLDGPAVRGDDPASDGEAKSGAAARPAAVQLEEGFEHLVALVRRDARSIVRDLDAQLVAGPFESNPNQATGRTVPQGVVDKNHQHLTEPVTIDLRLDSGL
jgi:hypothetical protein